MNNFPLKKSKATTRLYTLNPCQADALLMTGVFRDTYLRMSQGGLISHTFFWIKSIRMNSLVFQPSLVQDSASIKYIVCYHLKKWDFYCTIPSTEIHTVMPLKKILWRKKCRKKTRKPSFQAFRPKCDQPLKNHNPLSTTQRKMFNYLNIIK